MNICVIGNSHIAAIMLGWKQIEAEHPGITFTFFGAPGTLMEELRAEGRRLVPKTAELRDFLARTTSKPEISGDYECYVVCGLDFKIGVLRPLLARYRGESQTIDARTPLSDECFVQSLCGSLSACPAVKIIDRVKGITAAPVVLVPQALHAESAPFKWLSKAEADGEDSTIANYFWRACRKIGADLGVSVVLQPEYTKASPLRTKSAYSEGSIRLGSDAVHRKNEPFHMNSAYGVAIIRELLENNMPPERSAAAAHAIRSEPEAACAFVKPVLSA